MVVKALTWLIIVTAALFASMFATGLLSSPVERHAADVADCVRDRGYGYWRTSMWIPLEKFCETATTLNAIQRDIAADDGTLCTPCRRSNEGSHGEYWERHRRHDGRQDCRREADQGRRSLARRLIPLRAQEVT